MCDIGFKKWKNTYINWIKNSVVATWTFSGLFLVIITIFQMFWF